MANGNGNGSAKKILIGILITLMLGWWGFISITAISASSKSTTIAAVQETQFGHIKDSLCRIETKLDQHLADKGK